MNMYSAELDINYELTYESVKEYANEFGCDAILVEEEGPGGGNPVYSFTSTEKRSIINLVCDALWVDEEEAEEFVIYPN
jgi:hypothetical protein